MDAVKKVDKGNNRPFITSSPTNGLESIKENYIATNPQDPLYGDVHFYGFNNDTWNPATYPITRFLSETGMNSLPSLGFDHHSIPRFFANTFRSSCFCPVPFAT
ncbi:hypothetical protein I4U23_005028 [Adineta vaga]|nr:hypothetical protein I4U23_005028 [Adineta vaga]